MEKELHKAVLALAQDGWAHDTIVHSVKDYLDELSDSAVLHPDGSDCDYCTYDKPCITIVNTLPATLKNTVPNNNQEE